MSNGPTPNGASNGIPKASCDARLCVLSSSSRGNCSVVTVDDGVRRRACLIDAGLSPRRTYELLEEIGVELKHLDSVVLTHLDSDHLHPSWPGRWPPGITLRIHKRHLGRAERMGALTHRTEPFVGEFEIWPGIVASPIVAAHDSLGTAALRLFFPDGSSLGFATDLGRVNDDLLDHLRHVDVLAIESNYCPNLQSTSARPEFLKRRITGGKGHLSNEQCAAAIEGISPREHVVLLHLSRDCNNVDHVASLHEGSDYALTIAEPDKPTRWIAVNPPSTGARVIPAMYASRTLFDGQS